MDYQKLGRVQNSAILGNKLGGNWSSFSNGSTAKINLSDRLLFRRVENARNPKSQANEDTFDPSSIRLDSCPPRAVSFSRHLQNSNFVL